MNNARRKQINRLIAMIEQLIEDYDPDLYEECFALVDEIYSAEAEHLEQLSDSMIDTEFGLEMQDAVCNLSDAKICLRDAPDADFLDETNEILSDGIRYLKRAAE